MTRPRKAVIKASKHEIMVEAITRWVKAELRYNSEFMNGTVGRFSGEVDDIARGKYEVCRELLHYIKSIDGTIETDKTAKTAKTAKTTDTLKTKENDMNESDMQEQELQVQEDDVGAMWHQAQQEEEQQLKEGER